MPPPNRGAVDPRALRAALAELSHGRVDVRETHISWVFLTNDRAYKLKKPLVLPFLDYATPARRRRMCEREIRLNRRLAPDVYLGVRSVVADGDGITLGDEGARPAIDYLVEMRRYDENDTLAAVLDRGELTRSQVAEVARTLARFHARCRRASGTRGADTVEREISRNVDELLAVAAPRRERARIRGLARFMQAFIAAWAPDLSARAREGRIRECHGDLRAEHVVLERSVSVVDCVEFDPVLRTLDVADDLAFLVMDLAALGGERFGAQLVGTYRAAGGDCGDDALLSLFAINRALVRAKVLLLRAGQRPPSSAARGHANAQARDLIVLAERFSWRARLPLVIVICGLPASGKSYLAAALASASGLPRVTSDLVRKQLAGLKPTERAPAERYGQMWNRATYVQLGRRAVIEVAAHGGALIDATFRRRADRDAFAGAFAGAAPLVFVQCLAPVAVLADRARARDRDAERVSDATLSVVLQERESWEPLDEVPPDAHVVVRADREVELIVRDLLAWMDERLAEAAHA